MNKRNKFFLSGIFGDNELKNTIVEMVDAHEAGGGGLPVGFTAQNTGFDNDWGINNNVGGLLYSDPTIDGSGISLLFGSQDVADGVEDKGSLGVNYSSGAIIDPNSTASRTGIANLASGNNYGLGNSGPVNISSGYAANAKSGDINIYSGYSDGAATKSGKIKLENSACPGGVIGHIEMLSLFLLLPKRATDPVSPDLASGAVYYNTVSNKIKMYNGATWETITSA